MIDSPHPNSMIKFHVIGLLSIVLGVSGPALAQQPLPASRIALMKSETRSNDEILAAARRDCIAFVVDDEASRLARAGVDDELIRSLRSVCYKGPGLQVSTNPGGAELRVNGASVGVSPWFGPMSPQTVQLEVRRNGRSIPVQVDVLAGRWTVVQFTFAGDTAAVPAASSDEEIARLRRDLMSPLRDAAPPEPSQPRLRSGSSISIGGIAGAALAAGAGAALCKTTAFRNDPDGRGGFVSVEFKKRNTPCLAGSIGGGFAAGGFSGLTMARSRHRQDVAKFEKDIAGYPVAYANWKARYQSDSAQRSQTTLSRLNEALRLRAIRDTILISNASSRRESQVQRPPGVSHVEPRPFVPTQAKTR